jgi:hypothetical protein
MQTSIPATVSALLGALLAMPVTSNSAGEIEPLCSSPSVLAASADGRTLFVACTASRNIAVLDLVSNRLKASVRVPEPPSGLVVSRIWYQEWESCASCHDTDGRMDGLNWDLLNDGMDATRSYGWHR